MGKGTLGQVVKRAISDAAFRRQLQSDPEGALKGFDLTGDERAALRSGDASKLSSLGVDQRMSKVFIAGDAAASASKWASSDVSLGMNVPIVEGASIDEGLVTGGGRANDALINDAGGSVRSALGDQHDGGRAAIGGDPAAASGRSGLGDQHDGGRAPIGDGPVASGRSALGDQHDVARSAISDTDSRLAQVNAAFEGGDSAAGGRSALGDQHDVARSAISDTDSRLAQVNAAFEGGDSAAGGRSALGDQHDLARAAVDDAAAAGGESSLDISGQTRDTSVTSSDVGGRQTDAFVTADEMGNNVVASGSTGAESSLDISGQTRDTSVISGDVAGRQTDAFMTADEMGNDVTGRGSASYPDSADTQREALADDAAMANPEGYDQPNPNDS